MIKHNLLLIFRSFKRYKSTFIINLLGLSSALACCLLIYLWVSHEWSIDKFHEKDDQLFQVMKNKQNEKGIETTASTPGLLASSLAEEMPDIEYAASVFPPATNTLDGIISSGNVNIKAASKFASRNYFDIFSYNLIVGNKERALQDKYAVVISKELAVKLFTTVENARGKTIEWNHEWFSGTFIVSAVYEKISTNTSMPFDILFSYELCLEKFPAFQEWPNGGPGTYLILRKGVNIEQFNSKIASFIKSKHPQSNATLFISKYSDQYLYGAYENGKQSGGRIKYVKLFATLALFILVIACINFMNLSTAKASARLKEIGIKKAIGGSRKMLIYQYMEESVLMSFLSLIVAIVLVYLLLPQFNIIGGKHLSLSLDRNIFPAFVIIALITGLISGSYPAMYLSGLRPIKILKGKLDSSPVEMWARKGLVIFQFTISVILIVSVLVVYDQTKFINSRNLGFDKDSVIHFKKEGQLIESYETFLSAVKSIPGVIQASCMGGNNIPGINGFTTAVGWEEKNPDVNISFGQLEVGYDLMEALSYKIAEGRTFSKDLSSGGTEIILNETAIKSMGLKNPIGKNIMYKEQAYEIVGIVKDFHFESLYEPVKPCFFRLKTDARNIVVKIRKGTEKNTIDQLRMLSQQFNPGLPFDYKFLDADYQQLYVAEQRVNILSRYFAGIAILISCLGLFGLAAFTVERRLKEISIRKILGLNELGIVYLLSNDFTKLVVIAILIALPPGYFIAKDWLDSFAYRIDLSLWYFIGAGLTALFIAWVAVGAQTIKVARISPAQCLKSE